MRTIKLKVAYDGSGYHGFQKQKHGQTVQNKLEEVLSLLCNEPITTMGSGRTDAGVHALEQTVSFCTEGRIPCKNIVRAAARLLPPDIVILEAVEVEEDFHARYSAKGKTYLYKIAVNEMDSPFLYRYAWQLREELDLEAMNRAAALLLGTHDFSAFRSAGSVETDPNRTMTRAEWQKTSEGYSFRITGDGFLYHMVRNLVWSLVQVGLGKRKVEDFQAELNSGRCEFLNEPAPACGLYLEQVEY